MIITHEMFVPCFLLNEGAAVVMIVW